MSTINAENAHELKLQLMGYIEAAVRAGLASAVNDGKIVTLSPAAAISVAAIITVKVVQVLQREAML